jgi:hypothetical protein
MLEAEIAMKVPWFLYIAGASPLLQMVDARARSLGGNLHRVEAVVENAGYLPTNLTERALTARLAKPVRATLKVTGGEVVDEPATRDLGHLPGTRALQAPGGAPFANRRSVSWLVRATTADPKVEIEVASEKGGTERRGVDLR